MKTPKLSYVTPCGFLLLAALSGCSEPVTSPAAVGTPAYPIAPANERSGSVKGEGGVSIMLAGGSVLDLTDGLTAVDVAQTLVGAGVTIANVSYTGIAQALGTFTGGLSSVGIAQGIILSSGWAKDVEGPNTLEDVTRSNGTPGDADLTALSGFPTLDAAVLEFDFQVTLGTERVFIQYVFGSEEYNEYVGTVFNDVFAFFVNGVNCATVEGAAVSINTINNGANPNANNEVIAATNPGHYVNNDPFHPDVTGTTVPVGDLRDTEMDGLTVVLVCEADLDPTESDHTMKIAIADASDRLLDSWVLLKEGSFTTVAPGDDPGDEPGDPAPETEGCSAGFWSQNGLRMDTWPTVYAPEDLVSGLFTSASGYLGTASLLDALNGYQNSEAGRNTIDGAREILLRQAVAAVLNEERAGAAFPATSVAALQAEVNAALESGNRHEILQLAFKLDAWNNNYELDPDGNLVLDETTDQPVSTGACPQPGTT